MPIKPSGQLSFTDIANEFGATRPNRLSQFYRGGQYVADVTVNNKVPKSGVIAFSNMYGATRVYQLIIASNRENLDLRALFLSTFGDPGNVPIVLQVDIRGGVTIGGVGDYSLKIGQFPNGSYITVNNSGSIQGFAGGRNSGGGGSCVYGAYGGQQVVFNNYGQVLAGGGGGGVGGSGGTGGPGYYINTIAVGASGRVNSGIGQPVFCQTAVLDCNGACRLTHGSDARCENNDLGRAACNFAVIDGSCLACKRCYRDVRVDTAGGGGGAGGAGGFGQGYGRPRTDGDGGGGGSPGGQNAGAGGAGGKGGIGGDWGAGGAQGDTGQSGANGNAGAGQGGSAGAGGGPAGNYLVKGGANFAFNNQGQIAGGQA